MHPTQLYNVYMCDVQGPKKERYLRENNAQGENGKKFHCTWYVTFHQQVTVMHQL